MFMAGPALHREEPALYSHKSTYENVMKKYCFVSLLRFQKGLPPIGCRTASNL